jgi:S-formylglutathione hydrolase FrmB
MRKINRNNLIKRTAQILRNNEGASMVLVSVLAIIVLTAVVVLRVATTTFMASTNRQLNQDQAYELAASLGESINLLIEEDKFLIYDVTLDEYVTDSDTGVTTYYKTIYNQNGFEGLPDASVVAIVTETGDGSGRILEVTADVGSAEYIYTREYRQ